MKLFTAQQMRNADRAAADAGVSSLLLMESAGRAVAEAAGRHWPGTKHILILCGRGNNGGDGYVAARHLLLMGREVSVLEHARRSDDMSSADGRAARGAWLAHGEAGELNEGNLRAALGRHGLVIDALFGSGLSRALEEPFASLVEAVNGSGLPVFSVDVPSGVSTDEAELMGPHLRATRTVQLAGPKRASVLHPASEAYGAWEVADIGIPEAILETQSDVQVLTKEDVARWFPTRAQDTHKYKVGTVLVVAGSEEYMGAAEMACRGAYRAGAGLVTLAAEGRLAGSWPEIIFAPLHWDGDPLAGLEEIPEKRRQVRVIGPGLDKRALGVLPQLIGQSDAPTLLDAGALDGSDAWFEAVGEHGRCVLTPHAGEAAGLLGGSAGDIQADPIGSAQELARRSRAVTVLKGATTTIAAPDGRVAVSTKSHPGMATGGAGDVLSGILGAWLAGADDLFGRACAAVFVHGLAGKRAAERYGDGLVATDLVEAFPKVWLELSHR